jgi:glycosyltransferase involved in cell wall biosynthesis
MSCKQVLFDLSIKAFKKLGFSDILDNRHSIEAANVVSWFDFDMNDIELSRQLHEQNNEPIEIKRIIWFIPEINNPFWGGIHTILRFAAYFKEKWGVENCFAVIGNLSEDTIRNSIGLAFPILKGEEICVLTGEDGLQYLKGGDVSICTLWTTAFFSLKFNNVKRKFYFIQDYEPLFYPASSISALVEETYRFGFYGLTNTISLKNIYDNHYGGRSCYFTPSVNGDVFYPSKTGDRKDRMTVFFYARPGHPRNGFELGISALKKLKMRMGDGVRIVTAGSTWSPEDFGIEGVIENLGLLKYEETAELYRQCDAGLVMMFTRHPSYLPLEFMACGCPVVTNYNPATTWLLHDNDNCLLTRASASCISDRLYACLTNEDVRNHIIQKGLETVQDLDGWDEEMEKVFDYMSRGCCGDPPQ